MIKIVVIDDQDLDRNNTETVLSAHRDFTIAGVGKDGYEALRLGERHRPDIILLEINLPELDGIKAASILKCRFPETSAIILTHMDDDMGVFNALCSGVSGYLLKNADMEKLADGIRIVMNGGSLITPKVATKAFHLFSQLARDICRECPNHPVAGEFNLLPCPFPENLSRTEFRIIYYIGQGLSNQEIAEKICRKTGTVRNYISMILQKTSLRNRTQIALLALQNGIAQGVSGERSRCMNYRI